MQKSRRRYVFFGITIVLIAIVFLFTLSNKPLQATFSYPAVPIHAKEKEPLVEMSLPSETPIETDILQTEPSTPTRVRIPSINVDSRIIPMGINDKGEMDVPSGDTLGVGWYKFGTKPGNMGSPVLDAHVYAAFEDLDDLKKGERVYVTDENGIEREFVVEESTLYPYDHVPPYELFERADKKRLNLITCAGRPTLDGSTYTKRLIVYAVLAEEA